MLVILFHVDVKENDKPKMETTGWNENRIPDNYLNKIFQELVQK